MKFLVTDGIPLNCSPGTRRRVWEEQWKATEYELSHPNYCRHCNATGILDEWHEYGMLCMDTCPHCIDEDICPQCGKHWSDDLAEIILNDGSLGYCPFCGWSLADPNDVFSYLDDMESMEHECVYDDMRDLYDGI